LLSFPRFHGFGQTNRSTPSVLKPADKPETIVLLPKQEPCS